jgi:transposase
MAGWPSGS